MALRLVEPMERLGVDKGRWMVYYEDGRTFGPFPMEDVMTALETILKSRKDSVAKVQKQVAELQTAVRDCSLTVRPVYEAELKVKSQRLARLEADVKALEAEIERQNPELPGMTKHPKK